MKERAILLGASGLIGSHLLTLLIESPAYAEVTVLPAMLPKRCLMNQLQIKEASLCTIQNKLKD